MSSGSESDDDYVPGEPEQVSEEDSADDETNQQYEKELEQKAVKRKITGKQSTQNNKKTKESLVENKKEEIDEMPEQPLNPESEKKREDDLWAKFLEGTETKPKSTKNDNSSTKPPPAEESTKNTQIQKTTNKPDDEKSREKRIFEFAGETIVVEDNVIKERIATKPDVPTTAGTNSKVPMRGRQSGGLAGLISQINKKNTLSTLEKSKLDWNTYKKEEGVEDEIQNYNKGKNGYLDRQDFLERSDMRQYEIERDLRLSRRSKR